MALGWEIAVAFGWNDGRLLPPPSRVISTFADLARSGDLATHIEATLFRVLWGFLLGVVAGTALGALTGTSELARRLFDLALQALRNIPSIAWVPLFILWFGIFETSKVLLIAAGVFFPIYLSLSAAILDLDRKLVEVGRIFRLSRAAMVWRVFLPATLPAYFVALRNGLGLGWMFVVAAEFMGASSGLGFLLIDGQMTGNTPVILASIIAFAILGKLTDWALFSLGRHVLRWQDSVARARYRAAVLDIHALSMRYPNGHRALDRVDLSVKAGEIIGVVGASGCGKSTLLRLLAGLAQPSGGEIRLNGTPVTAPRPEIGLVFQEPRLMPWLTILDNVAFGIRYSDARERLLRCDEVLARVGLAAFAYHWPRELSGGMAQRVSLARALVCKPAILLLDEPFSALDELTRYDLQEHLLDLWRIDRPTMVLVTHDIEEALFLSDRIVILKGQPGRIEAATQIRLPRPRERTASQIQSFKQELLRALRAPTHRRLLEEVTP